MCQVPTSTAASMLAPLGTPSEPCHIATRKAFIQHFSHSTHCSQFPPLINIWVRLELLATLLLLLRGAQQNPPFPFILLFFFFNPVPCVYRRPNHLSATSHSSVRLGVLNWPLSHSLIRCTSTASRVKSPGLESNQRCSLHY